MSKDESNGGVSVLITVSPRKTKKYRAVFFRQGQYWKSVDFGAKGYEDYTIHKDERRKERYIERHRVREDWDEYTSAGSLSRYILWNKPTLRASYDDYVRRFGLKRYGQGITIEHI